jgi:predicted phosphodiesterase
MDPRIGLPSVAAVELGGVEFVRTHGTGAARGYEGRVAKTVWSESGSDDPVGVAGHTHELLDTHYDGVRILNPGSVTGATPATTATMLTATVEDGSLDVDTHEL